jgi:hypothetical protein
MTKKRPLFPVSSSRRVRLKVRGNKPTETSRDTKRGVKQLPDKGKDRISPCKTKR